MHQIYFDQFWAWSESKQDRLAADIIQNSLPDALLAFVAGAEKECFKLFGSRYREFGLIIKDLARFTQRDPDDLRRLLREGRGPWNVWAIAARMLGHKFKWEQIMPDPTQNFWQIAGMACATRKTRHVRLTKHAMEVDSIRIPEEILPIHHAALLAALYETESDKSFTELKYWQRLMHPYSTDYRLAASSSKVIEFHTRLFKYGLDDLKGHPDAAASLKQLDPDSVGILPLLGVISQLWNTYQLDWYFTQMGIENDHIWID